MKMSNHRAIQYEIVMTMEKKNLYYTCRLLTPDHRSHNSYETLDVVEHPKSGHFLG